MFMYIHVMSIKPPKSLNAILKWKKKKRRKEIAVVNSGFEDMCIAHFGFEKKNKAHWGKVYCCPDQIPYFVEILEKTQSTRRKTPIWWERVCHLMKFLSAGYQGSEECDIKHLTNIEICSNTTHNSTHTHTHRY